MLEQTEKFKNYARAPDDTNSEAARGRLDKIAQFLIHLVDLLGVDGDVTTGAQRTSFFVSSIFRLSVVKCLFDSRDPASKAR